jgi:hypothetical protein
MRVWCLLAVATMVCAAPATVLGQQHEPLPTFDLDARGFTVRTGQDATTAADLGVATSNLASRLNGFAFGGTYYPLRGKGAAVGVGVEGLFGRGIGSFPSPTGGAALAVPTYISGFAGEVSANFGHRNGWSYISVGAGPVRIDSFLGAAPLAEPPGKLTVNFGGGARWFTFPHLAVGFDARFYLEQGNPSDPPFFPGRGKKRIFVVSGGFSIR